MNRCKDCGNTAWEIEITADELKQLRDAVLATGQTSALADKVEQMSKCLGMLNHNTMILNLSR
jgi:hypothetical protein